MDGMTADLRHGDALDTLSTLPSGSVRCCITSPPYFGLRDYGADGQIGLEATPAEYVDKLVGVFQEVRRVLTGDGTLWVNLGDSYAGSWGAQGRPQGDGQMSGRSVASARQIGAHPRFVGLTGTRGQSEGLKAKDLMGIPWRVAFALQADGWYLRSDVIWSKPNPMPESVTDRPTKAHEYLFLLAKSERYYYDAEAIAEESVKGAAGSRFDTGKTGAHQLDRASAMERVDDGRRNKRTVWTVATQPFSEAHFATFPPELIRPCVLAGSQPGDTILDPFNGAGTTGLVALQHDRQYIGIDVNSDYLDITRRRLAPLLAQPRLLQAIA